MGGGARETPGTGRHAGAMGGVRWSPVGAPVRTGRRPTGSGAGRGSMEEHAAHGTGARVSSGREAKEVPGIGLDRDVGHLTPGRGFPAHRTGRGPTGDPETGATGVAGTGSTGVARTGYQGSARDGGPGVNPRRRGQGEYWAAGIRGPSGTGPRGHGGETLDICQRLGAGISHPYGQTLGVDNKNTILHNVDGSLPAPLAPVCW